MIKVSSIKLSLDYDDNEVINKVAMKLRISPSKIEEYKFLRRSIDARKKENICFIATVEVKLSIDEDKLLQKNKDNTITKSVPQVIKLGQPKQLSKRPVIVGFGPSGMFCALMLAKLGLKPIVIERGKAVDDRTADVNKFFITGKLDTESNVQFGEGGAGTFSDGKLNTGIKSIWAKEVLKEFVLNGATEDILYDAKPHIGTDKLRVVVKNIREKIISLGGEVKFQNKLIDITVKDGKIYAVKILDKLNDTIYEIDTDNLVLALGHSARDTFTMLYNKKIYMQSKSFSVGARIEHSQTLINQAQFGKYSNHHRITPADYKLATHLKNGRGVYTFCMCPGGVVVPATSEEGLVVTNGMSEYKRDKVNANSALLVSVSPDDFANKSALAGIEFQRKLEKSAFKLGGSNYKAPVQRVEDFLIGKPSYKIGDVVPSYEIGYTLCDLSECLPKFVVESMKEGIRNFNNKLKGFSYGDAVLTGVETRSSSPIRINRDENLNSVNCKGIFPCGEGCGYAGGIISAAVDGIKVANKLLEGRS